MKEAILYNSAKDGAVDCCLCNHRCHIADGKRGFCLVRENRHGTLYSLVYGRIVAANVEFMEKKPLYHFLPGSRSYSIATRGCNFRCPWCQNWEMSRAEGSGDFTELPNTEPVHVVEKARLEGCQSVCYTYTEPTIFMEYALDTARLARERGLKNVFVTNGYQTPEAVEVMKDIIDAANVDLKSFSEEFYRTQCHARLEHVLEAIGNMHAAGIWVEITTLIVPGGNDSEEELQDIASFVAGLSPDVPWHVTRFHPDYRVTDLGLTPVETMRRAIEIGREAGLRYVYAGNIILPEAKDTACPECGHVVVRRDGLGRTQCDLDGNRCRQCRTEMPVVTS